MPKHNYRFNMPTGRYATTGEPIAAHRTLGLVAVVGHFILSGEAAGLGLVRAPLIVPVGHYAVGGEADGTAHVVGFASGTYGLTGQAVGLALGRRYAIVVNAGSYALAGERSIRQVNVKQGSYALSGQAAGLTNTTGLNFPLPVGGYLLTGQLVKLPHSIEIKPTTGSYALSGEVSGPTIIRRPIINPVPGQYAITGESIGFSLPPLLAAAGSYALTGSPALLNTAAHQSMAAATGHYALTGEAVTLNLALSVTVNPDPGLYALTLVNPSYVVIVDIIPGFGGTGEGAVLVPDPPELMPELW